IIQGIGVGGEWGGSVLLSMEWGNQKRRGLSASWPQIGVPLGLVLSTGVVRITSGVTGTAGFAAYGWRIPFILSIVLIGVGLFVRLRVIESPEFEAIRLSKKVVKNPILEVIKRQPKQVLLSALVRTSEQAPFYLFITFVITYATKHLKLSSNSILDDTLIAAALGLISVPLFGRLSDRFGRRKVYGIGIVLTALFAFPYFGLLNTGNSILVAVAIVVSLVLHDIQYGPQAALIAESFDADIRYTGAGLGYQLASVVAGGPAPLIAAALLAYYGDSTSISIYIIICCAVAMAALILLPKAAKALATTATPEPVGRGA
ncbi:MAG TPA: MFS transporter, partial [Micrococcaceae bacterium]